MKNTIKTILSLWLLSALTVGVRTTLNAAETAVVKTAPKITPAALTGKIVAVDKTRKTVTVDIKGKLYVFKISSQCKIRIKDKEVPLEALSAGQEASLVASRAEDGRFEVVLVSIEGSPVRTEAAGGNNRPGPNRSLLPAPFPVEPNPANISGNVVSPNN